MRGEWFAFRPTFKLWFSTNHKPVIRGTDNAIWDRIRLIPFHYRFKDEEIRPAREVVDPIVAEEGPGILAWAVEGARRWYAEGLRPPRDVQEATNEYRAEQDTIGGFLIDGCVVRSVEAVSSHELYKAFEAYCEAVGERPMTQKSFSARIAERGFQKNRTRTGAIWNGLRLRRPGEEIVTGDGLVGVCGENAPEECETPKNPSQPVTDGSSVTGVTGCDGFSYISGDKKMPRVYYPEKASHPSHPSRGSGEERDVPAAEEVYRAHVRECLFCAIEEGEVVELCPDGKALFNAYLEAKRREKGVGA